MKIAPFVLNRAHARPRPASEWLKTREGVIAKKLDAPYRPGERVGMLKIRRERTLDCVVIGWREHIHGGAVGSLILGLYEPDGKIRHVGHSAGFPAKRARELVDVSCRSRPASGASRRRAAGRAARTRAGARSARAGGRGADRPRQRRRIRHGAKLVGFRDDKPPRECTVTSSTRERPHDHRLRPRAEDHQPDKLLYPQAGFTKGDVIEYYRRIAPVLLPHLRAAAR